MKESTISALKYLIGWPISIISGIFIISIIVNNWQSVAEYTRKVNIELFLYALSFFFVYFFLRSLLWKSILKMYGSNIPFADSAFQWSLSEISQYIPERIWPFIKRNRFFKKWSIEEHVLSKSILTEAQFIVLGIIIVSVFSLPIILDPLIPSEIAQTVVKIFIYTSAFLVTILYVFQSDIVISLKHLLKGDIKYFFPRLPTTSYLKFTIISILAFIFLGLGYYFFINSLVFIDPKLIVSLVGVFVFAYFVGYILPLIPAGLGIREAIIIVSIARFITVPLAAFAALCTRIAIIASGLVFAVLTYVWQKVNPSVLNKIEKTIAIYPNEAILTAATGLYIFYFTRVTFLRYDNFFAGRFDLGNMVQTVWNTAHGRIFQTNTDIEITSRLIAHADFFLVFLAPFYRLWEHPKMLLLFQTVFIAGGALFVYAIAKHVLKKKDISLLFATLYLINPSVEYSNLYDFHAVTLSTTLLLGTYYAFIKKQYTWFVILALFAGITKEHIWIIISFFGIWLVIVEILNMWKKKSYHPAKFIFGSLVFAASISIFFFLVGYAIPNARGGTPHFALEYYTDYGSKPSEVIINVLLSPKKVIETVLLPDRIDYLRQLFLPLSFLPLLSPLFLLFVIPDFLINLLSNNTQLHQIYYQYTAAISAFLFIAGIYGAKRLNSVLTPSHRIIMITVIGFFGIYGAYAYGPLPGSKIPSLDMFNKQVKNKEAIESFLEKIPENYSVSATNNVGAHVSERQKIYTFPNGVTDADIVIFLLNDPGARPSLDEQIAMAIALKQDPNYIILLEDCDFIALGRKDRIMKKFW